MESLRFHFQILINFNSKSYFSSDSLSIMSGSSNLTRIILAGVREQVNIPILLCQERKIFEKRGIEVDFRVVPEGTGAILDLIERKEIDIGLCVSDAFIAGRSKGRQAFLSGVYVDSPLCWAVAASPSSPYSSLKELSSWISSKSNDFKCRVGISRPGSGSHSMAFYLGQQNNIASNKFQFETLNKFEYLKKGIFDGNIDIFLWETFTTKPSFDNLELKKIGEIETPWPAFSFASRSFSTSKEDILISNAIRNQLFPSLEEGIALFTDAQSNLGVNIMSGEYQHSEEDARAWLRRTAYGTNNMSVNKKRWNDAVLILKQIGLVPSEFDSNHLYDSNIVTLSSI